MFVLAVAEPVEAASSGGLGISPPVVLVFGFVFLILLQAGMVRRITRLRAQRSDCKASYDKLREEVLTLGEQVSSLERARDSNGASIVALERENEVLQKLIEEFVAEHPELAASVVAPAEDEAPTEGEAPPEDESGAEPASTVATDS